MSRNMKRIATMLLAFVVAFGVLAVPTSAATKKLKNANFSTSTSAVKKKAVAVKKGTYTIKLGTKGKGYAKFKAPKTATYTFTVSGLKSGGSYGYTCGYFYVMTTYGTGNKYLEMRDLTTKGGKYHAMFVATKNSTSGTMKYRFLKSRYGKIKLKKNQTVYLYFNFSYGKDSFKLKIK